MFKTISEYLSLKLIKSKIINSEDSKLYSYGLELLLLKLFFYAIILLIALFTDTLIPSIIFLITYMALREYTGGYHCKSWEMCLLFSIFIYIILLFLINIYILFIPEFFIITAVLNYIIIIIFSPIVSENNPITRKEKKKYRLRSIIIAFIYIIICFLTFYFSISIIFIPVFWSLTADAVLILVTKIRRYSK